MFRGWSRLCLHAASLNAAEGALATTTAAARAVRAEAVEKEATAASEQAESWRRAAAASAEAAAVTEKARQEATGVLREAAKLTDRADRLEDSLRQEQGLRAGLLVRHIHQSFLCSTCLCVCFLSTNQLCMLVVYDLTVSVACRSLRVSGG